MPDIDTRTPEEIIDYDKHGLRPTMVIDTSAIAAILFHALSKATGEPLLFKGNDFSQTDITVC